MIGHYKRSKFLAEQVAVEAARDGLSGRHRQPIDPDRAGRRQANSHRPGDSRCRGRADAGVRRHGAQHRARRRRGGRSSHGVPSRPSRRALYSGGRGHDAPRDTRGGRAHRRSQTAARATAVCGGAAHRLRSGNRRQTDRPVRPGDVGGRAHVAQAHVLLERESGARPWLPVAPAGRGIRRCRALVSRARLAASVARGRRTPAGLPSPAR